MPTYQIIEKEGSRVTARLTADNGYSEVQEYMPPEGITEEECLVAATLSFNEGIMARQVSDITDPQTRETFPIVEVK